MKLKFTKAAVEDLQSVRDYTLETWGETQEAVYLKALLSKLRQLLDSPERFRKRDDLFPGCRIAGEGKHVVLFQVNDGMLEVVRILHSAMDYKRHLPPE